jgi:hypothetical protein
MYEKIESEKIIIHPYTYLPCISVKYKDIRYHNSIIRWFDIITKIELPPFVGYGKNISLNTWKPKIYDGTL